MLIICLHEGHAKACTASHILICSMYQIRGTTGSPSDEGIDGTFVSPDEPISSRDERRCLNDVLHERVRIPVHDAFGEALRQERMCPQSVKRTVGGTRTDVIGAGVAVIGAGIIVFGI